MITLPNPRTINEAIRQADTTERARQIIAQGYSFWPEADRDTIAICKPGFLHADYWLSDNGKTCDCPDFVKHQDYCKHVLANSIVEAEKIPTLASTNVQTVREFVAQRDAVPA